MTVVTELADKDALVGARAYNKWLLEGYDFLVHGFNTPVLWRIPLEEIKHFYASQISGNHLDVGVGTGLFLDCTEFPIAHPRVALMDLNKNSLAYTANRIARYQPEIYQANALSARQIAHCEIPAKFDSIGSNYLIHCLPGNMHRKAILFDNFMPLLHPRGVIFGATIVIDGVDPYFLSRQANRLFNKLKVFSNIHDSTDSLLDELSARFQQVTVELVGCVALFRASVPKLSLNATD